MWDLGIFLKASMFFTYSGSNFHKKTKCKTLPISTHLLLGFVVFLNYLDQVNTSYEYAKKFCSNQITLINNQKFYSIFKKCSCHLMYCYFITYRNYLSKSAISWINDAYITLTSSYAMSSHFLLICNFAWNCARIGATNFIFETSFDRSFCLY